MLAPISQIDAFTRQRFAGNQAAVVALESFPEDLTLQAITAENNLAETAFLVMQSGQYHPRWFTPMVEAPLCGHATLATVAVVMERLKPELDAVNFQTASGPLAVTRAAGAYVMDFPSRPSEKASLLPTLSYALGVEPVETHVNAFNYLALLEDASTVRNLSPDFAAIAGLDRPGVIVTAKGQDGCDFISRYFAPAKGIPEDPVTGGIRLLKAALRSLWALLPPSTHRHFQNLSQK